MKIIKEPLLHDSNAFLKGYLRDANPETHREKFPAIIVVPGGSFTHVPAQQSESFSLNFLSRGYQSFYLRYSLSSEKKPLYPAPLIELGLAIKMVREHAEKFNIDANHIFIAGFSIGGHVASLYNDFYTQKWYQKLIPNANESLLKPNAIILGYPVIDLKLGFPKNNQTIKAWVHNKVETASEKHVNNKNVPTFIWATANDPFVPSINSLKYAESLFKNHIPYELHIFNNGPHGMALANSITAKDKAHNNPHVAHWFNLACEWLKDK